jgi:hypothetical protein
LKIGIKMKHIKIDITVARGESLKSAKSICKLLKSSLEGLFHYGTWTVIFGGKKSPSQ